MFIINKQNSFNQRMLSFYITFIIWVCFLPVHAQRPHFTMIKGVSLSENGPDLNTSSVMSKMCSLKMVSFAF